MTKSLSASDKKKLASLEQVIETNRDGIFAAQIEIGEALSQVLNGELHRATHDSFEDYVEDRWEFSRAQAYRFINVASVVATLAEFDVKPTNEAQCREIARLSKTEDQQRLWAAVIKTGKRVTASLIAETRSRLFPRPTSRTHVVPDFITELKAEYDRLKKIDQDDLVSLANLRKAAETGHELLLTISRGSTIFTVLKNGHYSVVKYELVEDHGYQLDHLGNFEEVAEASQLLNGEFVGMVPQVVTEAEPVAA